MSLVFQGFRSACDLGILQHQPWMSGSGSGLAAIASVALQWKSFIVSLSSLLCIPCSSLCSWQELRYIEYFAGEGNVFAAVRKLYPAVAVDLSYLQDPAYARNNPMDINSPSGFACLVYHNRMPLSEPACFLSFLPALLIYKDCHLAGLAGPTKFVLFAAGNSLQQFCPNQCRNVQEINCIPKRQHFPALYTSSELHGKSAP